MTTMRAHARDHEKKKPGTRPGFVSYLLRNRDYWLFSSVRRLISLLQPGMV